MEETILLVMQQIRIGFIPDLFALISALGNSALIWLVVALVFLLFQERRQTGVIMLITIIITSIACTVISGVIARPCPLDSITGLFPVMGVSHSGHSFPSYHAATAFAAATVVMLTYNRGFGTICFVFAILESISRVYLCVNYPSDVIVGALMGIALGFVCYHLFTRVFGLVNINPRKPSRKAIGTSKGRRSL